MMAKYRYVHCSFWDDPDMLELTPEDKYFYLFLLTNPYTTQCGIYEISIKQMEYSTGYNRDTINRLIERFERYGKIRYNPDTREMALKNWAKYNVTSSPKVKACIDKELQGVKDRALIGYVHTIDTVSVPLDKEKEKEKQKEEIKDISSASPPKFSGKCIHPDGDCMNCEIQGCPILFIWNQYKNIMSAWYKPTLFSEKRKKAIGQRLKAFTVDEIVRAIENLSKSVWHVGHNPGGKFYADPEFIFRNDEQIEKWSQANGQQPCAQHGANSKAQKQFEAMAKLRAEGF